ncbi:MAG: hypothetical protein C0594_03330 [Marinilabiliales bacterium]|nr:MAG: hypothetical protein C0594_03330 [Marinilabiliales bacterium]
MKELDSTKYGLNKRIELCEVEPGKLGIVKIRKSRIIRKDAEQILDLVEKIRQSEPQSKIALICTKNICSKSIRLLDENDIEIIYTEG